MFPLIMFEYISAFSGEYVPEALIEDEDGFVDRLEVEALFDKSRLLLFEGSRVFQALRDAQETRTRVVGQAWGDVFECSDWAEVWSRIERYRRHSSFPIMP